VFALLGHPVAHSLSPRMQNAALLDAGLDGVYVALETAEGEVPGLLRGLARSGGGGNVTLPHKALAATVLDAATEAVRATGACNTFWSEGGRIFGDNTDVEGFVRALEGWRGSPAGMRVLLLGAGGAARAVVRGLVDAGVDALTILNRTPSAAQALAEASGSRRVRAAADRSDVEGRDWDLVVQATRLGLHPDDALPIDLERLGSVGALFDLVYAPRATAIMRAAEALGVPTTDGSEMLVQQGAAAFRRWWQQEPSLDVMRGALRASS
jgi:shikimate dehydrogenase